MFAFTCKKTKIEELKEMFIKTFSEMCLSGIDYYREDRKEMDKAIETAVEIIDGVYCGFEDTDDGFIVDHDNVYEIGVALAEELHDSNSFCDLFTNENVGATGKWIVTQIHTKFPNVGIDAVVEYDDGHNDTMIEHIYIQDGEVISQWSEGDEEEDDE